MGKSNHLLFSIDSRVKLLFIILINLVVYGNVPQFYQYLFSVFGLLLLLNYKKVGFVIKIILFYLSVYIIGFILNSSYLSKYIPGIVGATFIALSFAIKFYFPFIIFAYLLFATTKISEVSMVFGKYKVPQFLSISLLVLFRFVPTITLEIQSISKAMSLRGLSFGLKSLITKPVKTIEYMYVPLLFSLTKIGEELTRASLTRGLGLYKDRTYIGVLKFNLFDLVLTLMFIFLLILSFFAKRGVL